MTDSGSAHASGMPWRSRIVCSVSGEAVVRIAWWETSSDDVVVSALGSRVVHVAMTSSFVWTSCQR